MSVDISDLYQKLIEKYGAQGWWPVYNIEQEVDQSDLETTETGLCYHKGIYEYPTNDKQRFEISMGAILTQNTSWSNAEKALYNLEKEKILNPKRIAKIKLNRLKELIKPAGFYNRKSKTIMEYIDFIQNNDTFTRDNLLQVWGIGKETADSILNYAYKKQHFVVDKYTKRIFDRYGFQGKIDYDNIKQKVEAELSHDFKKLQEFHALLVKHGKIYCGKKTKCKKCFLNKKCNMSSK